ncbi:ABC transporter ATP-binding protein [Georgenia thermotolerans]|uniref:ATP-binding cassette domain-containing protein n=1 Tax=Georgenia thermotolerans TaxID=527326 RepID=A0A7J5UUY5_9MICO|nr:ABC transporter ATP-binding protein [Georgenia thermotolerans]KAE8766109.1 ATP-binding cassette domain-containing protein [Georgenia thermotolerans]
MISIDNVSQVFTTKTGTVHALENINLEVATNEFVTLVGRSGCGKSTLLRVIAGLITPTAGTVKVAGEPVRRPRRDVSVMFQRPALLPWRSVLDNLMLPVEILRLDRDAHRERAHQLLELAGLKGFEDKLPHELSGGMQQRVSLCRSLIQRPKVLLMDEPFSALDALTRAELSVELQRVVAEENTTIVFVTHSIDEAVLLADRVVVLSPRPGRLREVVDVGIPRPRTLGQNAHADEVTRVSARLHDLLMPEPEGAAA